jgi:hypothetical protein
MGPGQTRAALAHCFAHALVVLALGCGRMPAQSSAGEALVSPAVRHDALSRASVWHEPAVPVASAELAHNPAGPGSFGDATDVDCTFVPRHAGGTTPKFYCALAAGEIVKVKYGRGNAEIPAELAATRLVAALGFGADRMYRTRSVRCHGCPPFPFEALECLRRTNHAALCLQGADPARVVVLPDAVIERPIPGTPIASSDDEGWAWYELDAIDPSRGGASRAEIDALRLAAIVLAHWDNKSDNQRLVCLDGGAVGCAAPFAMIQDLGATFGPWKMDVVNWRRIPVWADRAACRVSMRMLPYGGGTFPDRRISEEGRLLAARLFGALTRAQARDLFEGAGVARFDQVAAEGRDPGAWADALMAKARQIADGPPCSSAAALAERGE